MIQRERDPETDNSIVLIDRVLVVVVVVVVGKG